MLIAGLVAGYTIGTIVTFALLVFGKSTGVMLIDRWWLENSDRWEWLRCYELKERDARSNG